MSFKEFIKNNNHIKQRGEKYISDILELVKDEKTEKYIEYKLKGDLDEHQYLQAVSEICMYLFLMDKGEVDYDYKIDENTDDINLFFKDKTEKYFIEVKSSSIIKVDKINSFDLDISNKVTGIEKEEMYREIGNDKLKSYLRFAQNKFQNVSFDKTNILTIALNTSAFENFLCYIKNAYTGILSYAMDPIIAYEEFNKIERIHLLNLISGHTIDANFKFNVWKLENYINFFIPTNMWIHEIRGIEAFSEYDDYIEYIKFVDKNYVKPTLLNNYPNKNIYFSKYINELHKEFIEDYESGNDENK